MEQKRITSLPSKVISKYEQTETSLNEMFESEQKKSDY